MPHPTGLRPADLLSGHSSPLETPWGPVFILEAENGWLAADPWCPHMQGPLWEGRSLGGNLTCPWHGWRYSLGSGHCTWKPEGAEDPAQGRLRIHAVDLGDDGSFRIQPPVPQPAPDEL